MLYSTIQKDMNHSNNCGAFMVVNIMKVALLDECTYACMLHFDLLQILTLAYHHAHTCQRCINDKR